MEKHSFHKYFLAFYFLFLIGGGGGGGGGVGGQFKSLRLSPVTRPGLCTIIMECLKFLFFLGGGGGAQLLSDGVLDSRLMGRGFEPQRRHCVMVREQDTFILA